MVSPTSILTVLRSFAALHPGYGLTFVSASGGTVPVVLPVGIAVRPPTPERVEAMAVDAVSFGEMLDALAAQEEDDEECACGCDEEPIAAVTIVEVNVNVEGCDNRVSVDVHLGDHLGEELGESAGEPVPEDDRGPLPGYGARLLPQHTAETVH